MNLFIPFVHLTVLIVCLEWPGSVLGAGATDEPHSYHLCPPGTYRLGGKRTEINRYTNMMFKY